MKKIFFGTYFRILCPVVIVLLIHLFASPAYFALTPGYNRCAECCNMQEKINRRDHLLQTVSDKYPGHTHMAKTEFRLTPPLLAKILFIKSKPGMYALQVAFGLMFFYLLTGLALKITGSKLLAFLFALSFGFLYPGSTFVNEMFGFFDAFAFFFLLVAMLDIPIILTALALLLAFFTDERAVISSGLIIFWWQYLQMQKTGKNFFTPSPGAWAWAAAITVYALLRWMLVVKFGFKNQLAGTGLGELVYTLQYAGLAGWQVFEGFWLLIVPALYYLYRNRQFALIAIFVGINLVLFTTALLVDDMSRSIAYMFPSIIIALYIVAKNFGAGLNFRLLLPAVVLICFICPAYNIGGKGLYPYSPVYLRAIKKIVTHTE